jgi:hypothetical protein
MAEWLQLAMRRDIVSRSRKVAILVGTILVAINYGDKLVTGSVVPVEWAKMVLTYCVPYCVSTYASVSAVLSEK